MSFKNLMLIFVSLLFAACAQEKKEPVAKAPAVKAEPSSEKSVKKKFNELTKFEKYILLEKGTERSFSGKYWDHKADGVYACKQCDTPLFDSKTKFKSGTGWPSFDDMIAENVLEVPDADGRRTEIVCAVCKGHLGHVFKGEGMTEKSIRHCVNSASLNFVDRKVYEKQEKEKAAKPKTERAIFASGCFWGTEYWLEKAKGVLSAKSGYIGGHKENPTYQEVCADVTGHAEAVEVIYDPSKTNFETLAKLFFETHDPGQLNRQGPDIGTQYRSGVFYLNDEQKKITEKLIADLKAKGYKVVTEVTKATKFYLAEEYHQNYYIRKEKKPYCHFYRQKF